MGGSQGHGQRAQLHHHASRVRSPAFAPRVPYVVALIDLDEGPRMMANIVGDDALDVAIGDRVKVTFEDRGDGAMLPQFKRAAG